MSSSSESSSDQPSKRSIEETHSSTVLDDSAAKRRRNYPIDETKLEEEDAKRLLERRAYNRQCAAKARQRSKDLISQLRTEVELLKADKVKLQQRNEAIHARLQLLEHQNRNLLLQVQQQQPIGSLLGGQATATPSLQTLTLLDILQQHQAGIPMGSSLQDSLRGLSFGKAQNTNLFAGTGGSK